MRKPEQKFWDLLKKNNVLPGDVSRVENTADTGTPDISAAYHKIGDYWVELKAVELDFCDCKKSLLDLLEDTQKVWHARRVKQGSKIYVMVRFNDAIYTFACIDRLEYHNIDVTLKEKNTFDYKKITKAIIDWEVPWF